MHGQIVAVIARDAFALPVDRALAAGRSLAILARALVGSADVVVASTTIALGAHAGVHIEPIEAHRLAATFDTDTFVNVLAQGVGASPYPAHRTEASEPVYAIDAVTLAAAHHFVAAFSPVWSDRAQQSRGGGDGCRWCFRFCRMGLETFEQVAVVLG